MNDYPDAMFVIDMQEQVIDYNPACLELLGLPQEEWAGRPVTEMCAGAPELLSAVRFGTESGQYVLTQDGDSKRLLRVTIAILKQPDGQPAGKLVVMRKVTTGSLGLRQEEGTARIRASLLFQMVPSALLTVNSRGIITYLNPAALAMMGFGQEEVLGHPCHDFMDQECAEACWINHPDQAGPVRNMRCSLRTKSGEHRTVLKNVELLRAANGAVIGAIESFEDITERERLEHNLRMSEGALSQPVSEYAEWFWFIRNGPGQRHPPGRFSPGRDEPGLSTSAGGVGDQSDWETCQPAFPHQWNRIYSPVWTGSFRRRSLAARRVCA